MPAVRSGDHGHGGADYRSGVTPGEQHEQRALGRSDFTWASNTRA
jgi:hypothetical protein